MRKTSLLVTAAMGLGLFMAGCVEAPQPEPVQNANLAGNWQVTAINGATIPGVTVTMDMGDGKVAGSSGCNRYNSTYTQSGYTLTFADGAMTRMACAPADMDAEARFGQALSRVTSYSFATDGALQMFAGNALVLQASRR
ncbi:META domain-containing protein [Pseudorhodobacter sp.]|uniref:META domain-containing protein n=1 Tax=Pseudorhodobacter sp. TaxID=1934400 RepID=UPI002B001D3C|nr:META domain-containing protein [Pseudorhodobacter sp.]